MLPKIRRFLRPKPKAPCYALALDGGGARAAYQAGVLKYIAESFPSLHFPVMTGVSAGAINTSHLANHTGPFQEAADNLVTNWMELTPDDVYQSESGMAILWNFFRGRGRVESKTMRGLVNTSPLRRYLQRKMKTQDTLQGVAENLARGRLRACAVITTNYTTGQSVTWVQGDRIEHWQRPNRIGINTRLTLDHVMASTALPLIFPAVRIGEAWYGDGGIRLAAPLAPAIHLGADRILVISTRYAKTRAEADRPDFAGYPPAAQIFGILMHAVFLDALDQDAHMLQRINTLLEQLPPRKRLDLNPIRLLLLRPSRDLGQLAAEYEARIPSALTLFARVLGSRETRSPDWLSMLLFDDAYMTRIMDIGYEDARRQISRIEEFLEDSALAPAPAVARESVPATAADTKG